MYNIELHFQIIHIKTLKLFFLSLFLCFFYLQLDLKQSLNVLALWLIKRYLKWARSLCTFVFFVVIWRILDVLLNDSGSITYLFKNNILPKRKQKRKIYKEKFTMIRTPFQPKILSTVLRLTQSATLLWFDYYKLIIEVLKFCKNHEFGLIMGPDSTLINQ